MNPHVAIVIPTYGHFEYANQAIESAAKTPGASLIIVDDGSDDWPGERVISGLVGQTPHTILRREHDANLSRSWNTGYAMAKSQNLPYIVFANSDLLFPAGWWPPLRSCLYDHAFAGPVTNAPGHVANQAVQNYTPYEVTDDTDLILQTQRSLYEMDHPTIPTPVLNGFCFAAEMTELEKLGQAPFNESIPLAGNESDLFRRARKADLKAVIVPSSFVFHYRSVSRGFHSKSYKAGHFRIPGCSGCGRKRAKAKSR